MWRSIKGYEGRYEVSDDGFIKTLPKIKGVYITKTHITAGSPDKNGYLRVTLRDKNGFTKTKKIHRLVAETFIPNPERLPEVNHKNGNKKDNSIENLEWITTADNIRHAIKHGLRGKPYQSKRVTIIDKRNDSKKEFESMKKASLWLGHTRQYLAKLAAHKKKEEFEVGNYVIKIEQYCYR